MPHFCRGCALKYYGSSCPRCCEHGDDRPDCERCLLEGKRIDGDVVEGEYEPAASM
jgi:predicted amidophosphoribosyltransferase